MNLLPQVIDVRFEHHREPLGIGETVPRLSWKVSGAPDGWTQAGYEVETSDPATGIGSLTGRIPSGESVLVPWPATALASRDQRRLRVRVWGTSSDEASDWSASAAVEAGLLRPQDWTAAWISPDWDDETVEDQPAAMFRRDFQVRADVARARLFVTAHGVYEAELNGIRVGDQVLAPGCLRAPSTRIRAQEGGDRPRMGLEVRPRTARRGPCARRLRRASLHVIPTSLSAR